MSETSVIVNPQGKPLRTKPTSTCPQCGKGEECKRSAQTFGGERWHCINCGYDYPEGEP